MLSSLYYIPILCFSYNISITSSSNDKARELGKLRPLGAAFTDQPPRASLEEFGGLIGAFMTFFNVFHGVHSVFKSLPHLRSCRG